MADSSSSAAASTGLNLTGGGISHGGQPNYVAWVVGALVVIVLGYVFLRKGKKGRK